MRLLHLVDDEKFINFTADVFDGVPDAESDFVVFVDDPSQQLLHTAGLHRTRLRARRDRSPPLFASPYDAVVIHYLDLVKIGFMRRLQQRMPVVWSGWGGDYYEVLAALEHGLLGEQTERISRTLRNRHAGPRRWAAAARQWVTRQAHEASMRRFMREVDYFSAPIPDDFELLRPFLAPSTRYVQLNYASVERTFDVGEPRVIATRAKDILVGNSASATNNHVEMFELLAEASLPTETRIVVPLNYGYPRYRDAVLAAGQRILGSRFSPLVDFMPLERYNSLIASCGSVVMGHRRQQAVGNIVTMMYKGARVFVDERTTTFRFLRDRGAVINGLRELLTHLNVALTVEERRRNREVIDTFWRHERVCANARELVGLLR